MAGPVLLVDDDDSFLALVEFELGEAGLACAKANTAADALALVESAEPSVVLLDLNLPDMSGHEVLERIRTRHPKLPVVMLTARGSVDDVVRCMRLGAVDYVQKPFETTRLVTSVNNARLRGDLQARVASLTAELRSGEGFDRLIGDSPAMSRTKTLLARAAASDVTVLLTGQSGTGKEVAARSLHAESERRSGPFVAVNCGAIPENLIESELFGHEVGAFSGATTKHRGRFEQAHEGTLFLDEIGELRIDLQVRLLRVLQERVVCRLGSEIDRDVDVRVIAATNRDLRQAVADGEFREDLFYRLSVFPVGLPPLRERDGDVERLAHVFLERAARRHGAAVSGFASDATRALARYAWPGNVRELENVIERAVLLEDGERVSLGSLPDEVLATLDEVTPPTPAAAPPAAPVRRETETAVASSPASGPDHGDAPEPEDEIRPLHEEEKAIVRRALELTNGNVLQAAKRLGIGRATIYRKIERYDLRPDAASDG